MTLRVALRWAAFEVEDTGELGSKPAAAELRRLAGLPSGDDGVCTVHGAKWAALRMAGAALFYTTEHAAMSLLCAQLADKYGPP